MDLITDITSSVNSKTTHSLTYLFVFLNEKFGLGGTEDETDDS